LSVFFRNFCLQPFGEKAPNQDLYVFYLSDSKNPTCPRDPKGTLQSLQILRLVGGHQSSASGFLVILSSLCVREAWKYGERALRSGWAKLSEMAHFAGELREQTLHFMGKMKIISWRYRYE